MRRRDLLIGGVALAVTVGCWAASIAYDAGQLEVDSFAEGERWSLENQPTQPECEAQMFRVMGPSVNGDSWLAGCLAPPGVLPAVPPPIPDAPPGVVPDAPPGVVPDTPPEVVPDAPPG